MTDRTWLRLLLVHVAALAALAGVAPAHAQEDESYEDESYEEDSGEETSADEGDSGEDIDTSEWQLPRTLVVAGPRVHTSIASQVNDVLRGVAEVVDGRSFARRAQREGLRPTSDTAYERLLGEENVALVVELQRGRIRFIPTVRVIYREGRGGFVLLETQHPLSGLRLLGAERRRIADEVRLALAVTTRPPGSSGPAISDELRREADDDRPRDEDEPGSVIEVEIAAGAGMGTRSFRLPTQAGELRLDTTPFPAARVDLGLHMRPNAESRLRAGFSLGYATSIGLRTTDRRIDGSTRETGSRSQRLDAQVDLDVRLGRGREAVELLVALGWTLRRFSTEAPVTLPDFGLGGPRLGVGLRVPLLGGRLVLYAMPDLQLLVRASDALRDDGLEGTSIALGAAAGVSLRLADALRARLDYRESHALLSSERGDGRDVDRYVALQLVYAP
ncbi:MAG: hypothetical protein H6721_07240 [Sandaracinus sp.]|nr:hypothetical protein [Sandaracinus sp.]